MYVFCLLAQFLMEKMLYLFVLSALTKFVSIKNLLLLLLEK